MIKVEAIIRCSCGCEKCGWDGDGTDQVGALIPINADGSMDMDNVYVRGPPLGEDWLLLPNGWTLCPKCQAKIHRAYWINK